jgi:translation initiation factor IF-2
MTEIQEKTKSGIRPPVVVILGHVDHGKTKLLDTIRKTNVVDKESGGITQHIGAYQTSVNGKVITFLDTPGHEAFSAIRSRGVKVADIAVLVVAADEGVKPQTKEAIKTIQEEGISLIVALNKIDKEGSNPQRVKQELAGESVLVEDWGGKVPVIEISAKDGKNIKELLDMILLVAELEELSEDMSLPAEGVIIESNLDKRRGYVSTALVKKGVVSVGDWIVAGTVIGKVKSMEDFTGLPMTKALPSQPVVITGWPTSPDIGKKFITASSKQAAERIAEENVDLSPLIAFFKDPLLAEGEALNLNLVLKSDVSSSLEAIESALKAIKSEEVKYRVVSYGVGNITDADVKSARASSAQIIGFRVGTEDSAKKLAEKEGIKISNFEIIYDLIGFIREELGGLLKPEIIRKNLGKLRVLAIFKKDSRAQVIGGKVISGQVLRGAIGEINRGGKLFVTGKIGQLQQNKQDVPEVKEGLECGIRFDILKDGVEIKEGDILEIYEEEKLARSL